MDVETMLSQVNDSALVFQAIRAQGAGGQNVNKVSSAIHLRFDIEKSGLSESIRAKLQQLSDRRVLTTGEIVIKAQRFRTQAQNKADALERLAEMITQAARVEVNRVATKPTFSSKLRRLDTKSRNSSIKLMRRKDNFGD